MTNTFNGWPESHDGTAPSGERSHVALLGVRSDLGASTNGGGQSGAPTAIRAVSGLSGSSYDPARGGDGVRLSCVDCNDVVPLFRHITQLTDDIAEIVAEISKNTDTVILLGGDDSVNIGGLAGFVDESPVHVIHYDAHPDTYPDEEGEVDHANWVTEVVNDGYAGKVQQHGVRALGLSADHYAQRVKMGITLETLWGPPDVPLFVAIDIDVVDPAYAPGVSTPVPGGVASHALIQRMHMLGEKHEVRYLSITEVNPARDINGMTSALAVSLIHAFLNGKEKRTASTRS